MNIPPEVFNLSHKAVKAWLAIQHGAEPIPKVVAGITGIRLRDAQRALKELREAGLSVRIRRLDASESDASTPSAHVTPPATMVLSSSSLFPLREEGPEGAIQIVEAMVKYRHVHRRAFRSKQFTLYPKTQVQWLKTANYLLNTDHRPLEEILVLIDYAGSQDNWRSRISKPFELRQHYDQLLHDYRVSQVSDLYPDGHPHAE